MRTCKLRYRSLVASLPLLLMCLGACIDSGSFGPDPTPDPDPDPDPTPIPLVIPEYEAWLEGAGSYAGECGGLCRYDLEFLYGNDDAILRLVGSGWDNTIYLENTAWLTQVGLDRAASLAGSLAGQELQEVYGCPDCADQGGFYLERSVFGNQSRHDYDAYDLPPVFDEVHPFLRSLVNDLANCAGNQYMQIQPECAQAD